MPATKKISGAFNRILESYITVYVVLGVIFLVLLSPLVLMFFTAFKTPAETEMWPPTIVPLDVDFAAFADVIFNSKIPSAIVNSLVISLSTVAIVVVAMNMHAPRAPPKRFQLLRLERMGGSPFRFELGL